MNPIVTVSVGLLVFQASLLVLTGGIFVTTMISAYETLSLLRRTLRDTSKVLHTLEAFVDDLKTKSSI